MLEKALLFLHAKNLLIFGHIQKIIKKNKKEII
jgi:hypothetical protein